MPILHYWPAALHHLAHRAQTPAFGRGTQPDARKGLLAQARRSRSPLQRTPTPPQPSRCSELSSTAHIQTLRFSSWLSAQCAAKAARPSMACAPRACLQRSRSHTRRRMTFSASSGDLEIAAWPERPHARRPPVAAQSCSTSEQSGAAQGASEGASGAIDAPAAVTRISWSGMCTCIGASSCECTPCCPS